MTKKELIKAVIAGMGHNEKLAVLNALIERTNDDGILDYIDASDAIQQVQQ